MPSGGQSTLGESPISVFCNTGPYESRRIGEYYRQDPIAGTTRRAMMRAIREPATCFATGSAAERETVVPSSNDRAGARTQDLRIKSPLLYQLSYPVPGNKHRHGRGLSQAQVRFAPHDRPCPLRNCPQTPSSPGKWAIHACLVAASADEKVSGNHRSEDRARHPAHANQCVANAPLDRHLVMTRTTQPRPPAQLCPISHRVDRYCEEIPLGKMEKKLVLHREFLTLGASFGTGCHSSTTLLEALMAAKKRRKAAKKKAAKRKVTRRKATKRKTTKRKTTKRKAAKRKTKRKAAKKKKKKKTTRRKAAKRRPKKKAAKRKVAKKKKKKTTRRKAAKRRPKKKTAKRKVAKRKKSKRKPSAAFMKPVQPDAALATVVGSSPLPRTQITKKLWAYIKRRGLQDSKNRRMINADDNLRRVFNGRSQVSMFEMTKLVSRHVS